MIFRMNGRRVLNLSQAKSGESFDSALVVDPETFFRPSSFMASRSKKGIEIKKAVGEENYNCFSTENLGDAPTDYLRDESEPSIEFKPSAPGHKFLQGSKSALDAPLPTDGPVYHVRVRDIRTGEPKIIAVRDVFGIGEPN